MASLGELCDFKYETSLDQIQAQTHFNRNDPMLYKFFISLNKDLNLDEIEYYKSIIQILEEKENKQYKQAVEKMNDYANQEVPEDNKVIYGEPMVPR